MPTPALDRRLTLYFGTDSPDGTVTNTQWQDFATGVVLSNFPDGATLSNALGTYRMADGRDVTEATHVLSVLYPHGNAAEVNRRVATVVDAYKSRFKQESVLDVRERVTGTFR